MSNTRYPPLVDLEDDVDPRERDLMRIDAMLARAHQPGRDTLTTIWDENQSILDWLREQFA